MTKTPTGHNLKIGSNKSIDINTVNDTITLVYKGENMASQGFYGTDKFSEVWNKIEGLIKLSYQICK